MGVLGKNLFDIDRPRTHVKVQFGTEGYWVEDYPTMFPYGAALTALLNYGSGDTAVLHNRIVRLYLSAGEDVTAIRERYTWFLEDAFPPVFEKKKGQRKKPLAQRIYERGLDALVSGVSLGQSPEVDAPQVNIQYAVLEIDEEHHELVEKLYFDRLADFVYVELMRGLQRGFVPKRCANCGRWFLQTPGASYNYCDQPAPNSEEGKTCREVGSSKSFRAILDNDRAYIPGLDLSQHSLKARTVEAGAGVAVVHEKAVWYKAVFLGVLFQHEFLVLDAVAIPLIAVVTGKAAIEG